MTKALCIDDDSLFGEPLRQGLELMSIEVDNVTTASHALEIISKGLTEYDVVLLDLMMRSDGIDVHEDEQYTGLALYRKIREVSKIKPVLIISIVRDARSRLSPKIRQDSKVRVLSKPVSFVKVAECINEVVK